MTFRADIEGRAGLIRNLKILSALCMTVLFSASLFVTGPSSVHAATPEDLQAVIDESSAEYEAATARVAELDEQIAANEAKIEGLERRLPQLEAAGNEALISLYKSQTGGSTFFQLVLGSESWDDFILQVEYLNRIESDSLAAIEQAQAAREELRTATEQLQADRAEAVEQQQAAADALAAAVAAKEEAMRIAAEQAAAEVAAAEGNASYSEDNPAPSGSVNYDEVDWSQDKATYVANWAPRIDAYLAGSPLSGYGSVFASAAWDYGVDPRWSPAISFVESSRGANCRRSYNAWGWLGHDFSSWEEGINEHVAYLARSYGSTLTMEAAAKYCPPGGDWYNKVYNQMQQI